MAYKMVRKIVISCLSALMLVSLSGCKLADVNLLKAVHIIKGSSEQDKDTTVGNGSASTDVENLKIDWVSGSVTIVYGDVDEIQFEETAKKALDSDAQMRYKEENGTLTIYFCKSKNVNDVPSKKLTITLPNEYRFDKVEMGVVSADVSLPEGFAADTLKFEDVSGEIISEGAISVSDIKVETVSGNIELEISDLDVFKLEAVSAKAKLILPEYTGFSVDINSVSGEFTTDFEGDFDGNFKKGTFTHGDGDAKITLESVSGDLDIFMQQ